MEWMVDALLGRLGLEGQGVEPLCIRFANTVGERNGPDPDEYLKSADDVRRWMVAQSILAPDASFRPSDLSRAIELRDAFYRLFSAIAAGRSPDEAALETLNGELAEALNKVELDSNLAWSLTETDPVDRAFMLLALSAASLASSPLAERVRECANATCGWIFVDLSKNRSRRWCSMSDCGNLEKARRFQAKRRGVRGPGTDGR